MQSRRVTSSAILKILCPLEAAGDITFASTTTTTVLYTGTDPRVKVGSLVTGTNWTNGTTITAVTPGVSFTTSAAPGAGVTAATIIDVTMRTGSMGASSGTSVLIRNSDATATNTVLIGGPDLTSSNGTTIPGGSVVPLDLVYDQVYCLAGTGTPVVEVLRLN